MTRSTGWFSSILIAFLIAVVPNLGAQEKSKPIRALLVIGGCCHDYAKQKDILTKGISSRANVKWTVAYDPDKGTKHLNPVYESADWAKNFDVIVHDECCSDVKDLTIINRILEPHRQGLPAVVLHCGMHCYPPLILLKSTSTYASPAPLSSCIPKRCGTDESGSRTLTKLLIRTLCGGSQSRNSFYQTHALIHPIVNINRESDLAKPEHKSPTFI